MKKYVLIMLLIVLSVSLIAACGNGKVIQSDDTKGENAVVNDSKNVADNVNPSEFVGMEKAREIALKRANLDGNGAIFEKTELENDDGIWKYEIEFRFNNIEYDVEIKADTGEVISYETDVND